MTRIYPTGYRVSPDLIRDMREIARIRVEKKLADPFKNHNSEVSIREMTELLRRTDAYKQVLEELRTKPKKR